MLPARLPSTRNATSWIAFFIFNVFAACGISFAAGTPAPDVTFDLVASEYEINEGDVIEFDIVDKQYRDPSTAEVLKFEADLSPVKWDFGDDRVAPAEAYGLYNIKHWFEKDRETPYLVNAAHQGTTKSVSIQVRNVLPKMHNVSVTQNPQVGKPVVFKAVARDPGAADDLTYAWNFGDGSNAEGPNAIHTYAKSGTYQISLTVEDEEGRENPSAIQGGNFALKVGDPFDFSNQPLNTIAVSGDITGSGGEIRGTIIAGSTRNPTSNKAAGACQIRLEMRLGAEDMSATLTARLDPGFAPGNYNIGSTTEWGGMHSDDRSTQGTFFAEFSPPKDQARRNFGGQSVGGPFWSDNGRVKIARFGDGELELYFEADLTENIPSSFQPRKVHVTGALRTYVPVLAPAVAGGDIEATANLPMPDSQAPSMRPAFDLRAYYCGGEEPAEFEVIGSNPGSNAVNARFLDSAVKVEFSQVVDSDSLVHPETLDDNLQLYILSAEGNYFGARGGWVVSPDNPKVVQFTPQARLLPGVTYCVFIRAGELGVRSFGGNTLAGISLEGASAEMARACPAQAGYQFGFAFSTMVELESAWVDVYQISLLGEHARLMYTDLDSRHRPAIVRVYTYWQSVSDGTMAQERRIHPNALVREFPVRVFGMEDGQPLKALAPGWEDVAPGPVSTTIKRSDLYTNDEKRHARHTINFEAVQTALKSNYFAVIQPLSNAGVPLDPVFPGVPVEVAKLEDDLVLGVYYMLVEGNCAPGISQGQCGWRGPWDDDLKGLAQLEIIRTSNTLKAWVQAPLLADWGSRRFDIEQECPGVYQDGVCYNEDQVVGEEGDSGRINLDALAVQVTNSYLEGAEYKKTYALLVAIVPPGVLPDSVNEPILVYPNTFPTPPVIFVQPDRINNTALSAYLLKALLGDEACGFRPDEVCTQIPVQGEDDRTNNRSFNKHHVEGNEYSDQLNPLLKSVPYDQWNQEDFHISAYNFRKLYEALQRRHDYANGNSPDS